MSLVEPPSRARNIQKTVTFDRERLEAVEAIARGSAISLSAAISRLVDLHAGVLLEEIEARPAEVFEAGQWHERRLTRELVQELAGTVREGSTRPDAYRMAEVTPKQGERWEKRGRADMEKRQRSVYADLVASLERARAEFNKETIQELKRKGAPKDLLKLLDPAQFSEVRRSEVDVRHSFQLVIDWDRLSIEKTRTLVALLREASPLEGESTITRTARPALEAIPPDVAELVDGETIEDAEWSEPPALEAPALDTKAPALDEAALVQDDPSGQADDLVS